MQSWTPQEIIKAIPEARIIPIPKNWFSSLSRDIKIADHLREWLLKNHLITEDQDLSHYLYGGKLFINQFYNHQEQYEKQRKKQKKKPLKTYFSLRTAALEISPKFLNRSITGNVLLIIPKTSEVDTKIDHLYRQKQNKERKKIYPRHQVIIFTNG